MPNEPRLQVRTILTTCAEFQYRTAQEASPRSISIVASASGTMNASAGTVTSVNFGSTSTHVGCFLIPEDGAIRQQARQIVKYVVSTNVATVDVPWSSSTGVTTFRTWMPAEVPVRSTATGTTTTVISSAHANVTAEPDDIWNSTGYYLLARTTGSSNAGGAFKVNDFTQSTGTFDVTNDAFVGAPADGDLFLLRKLLRTEGPPTVTIDRKTIQRPVQGFRSADQPVVITSDNSIEFMLAQRPLSASAGSGVTATPPFEVGEVLRDFMTQNLDVGSTVSSSGSSVVTPAGGTFTVNGFVLFNTGEASQIEGSSGGVISVPQMVTAPTASSTLYASASYVAKTSNFFTRAFDCWQGRIERQYLAGCVPTCELSITRDQIITYSFKYTAGEGVQYNSGDPNTLSGHLFSLLDTTVPVDGKGARVMLNGVRVLVGDIKINFGPAPILRNCLSGLNQYDGAAFNFEPVKLTMTGYLADNDDTSGAVDMHDMLETGQPVRFFYQKGSNPKETFCCAIPALGITKSTFGMENQLGAFSLEGVAVQPQLVRGASGVSTSLADFALGYL